MQQNEDPLCPLHSIYISENSKYLKSIDDTSVTECDEFINVMATIARTKGSTTSTKMTNTIRTKKTNLIIL